jgi:leader peptidase (prepilin peptidase) / N-methyltransferase
MWMVPLLFAAGLVAGGSGRCLLRGLRRGTRVPPPWCELAVGALWALAGAVLPLWWLPVPLVVGWFGVLLAATDLARQRLPDALTLPAYPVVFVTLGAVSLLGPGPDPLLRSLTAAVLFLAAHAVVRLTMPAALGAGDVKLSGVVGAVLGAVSWPAVVVGAVAASLITLVLAVVLRRRGGVPHGPGMLAAAWLLTLVPP